MSKSVTNYNSIAWAYDFLAKLFFLNRIKKAQTIFIKDIPENSHILIIGGGTGHILYEILTHTQTTKIVYIDSSVKMLEKAQYRLRNLNSSQQQRVEFILGTEQAIPSYYSFDCICTHFFLDLFTEIELDAIMLQLSSLCKAKALWFFADFQRTNFLFHKLLLKLMFLFFKYATNNSSSTLPDYEKSFKQLGWTKLKSTYFYNKMIESSLFYKQ